MDLIWFFIGTMYFMGFLGVLLILYLRRVQSKDSKKKIVVCSSYARIHKG
jgi:hypothetical protein